MNLNVGYSRSADGTRLPRCSATWLIALYQWQLTLQT